MNSKTYDTLKLVAQIVLPALATFYFALAGIWHLPAASEVVATITTVDTLLGAMLVFLSKMHSVPTSGDIEVTTLENGRRRFLLVLNDEDVAATIDQQEQVTLNIVNK